ncbi:MAG: hypothetical protein WC505_01285 [Patescibacteria group bacterium]
MERGEREHNPAETAEAQPLNDAELDEVYSFVTGELRDYLNGMKEGNNRLYRKANIPVDSDRAVEISYGADRDRIRAMPPEKQRHVYRDVLLLKELLKIGAHVST